MYFLWLLWYVTSVNSVNSYILVAANLDDIKSIAKKFVPDQFADRLAHAVSEHTLRKNIEEQTEKVNDLEEIEYDESTLETISKPHFKGRILNEEDKRSTKIKKINFEELVKKVKKRLEKEFKKIYKTQDNRHDKKNTTTKSIQASSKPGINRQGNPKKKLFKPDNSKNTDDSFSKEKRKNQGVPKNIKQRTMKTLRTTESVTTDDGTKNSPQSKNILPHKSLIKFRPVIQKRNNTINKEPKLGVHPTYKKNKLMQNVSNNNPKQQGDIFQETFLMKKDSYEDYVMPKKDSMYASDEKTTKLVFQKMQLKVKDLDKKEKKMSSDNRNISKKITGDTDIKTIKVTTTEEIYADYTEKTVVSSEIKAKTENLLFDKYNGTEMYKRGKNNENKIATVMPTRHRFKVKTPEFIGKTTPFAEKYNFDEPIPENDRVRENLKFFGDPIVTVNKKNKLVQF